MLGFKLETNQPFKFRVLGLKLETNQPFKFRVLGLKWETNQPDIFRLFGWRNISTSHTSSMRLEEGGSVYKLEALQPFMQESCKSREASTIVE